MRSDIAIIIPTKNRLDWCLLRAKFHMNSNFTGLLLFVDSSDLDRSVEFMAYATSLEKTNIAYYHIENLGVHQAIEFGLNLIRNSYKYVVISGDDDFHLPKGLYDSASFLDREIEYFAVCGPAIISRFRIDNTKAKILSSSNYWTKRAILDTDPFNRFNTIVRDYYNLEFSLKHVGKYSEIVKEVNSIFLDSSFKASTTSEYCSSVAIALEGKIAWIDSPFLIRGEHLLRPNSFSGNANLDLNLQGELHKRNLLIGAFIQKRYSDSIPDFSISEYCTILDAKDESQLCLKKSEIEKIRILNFFLRVKRRSISIYLRLRYRRYFRWFA